MYFMLSTYERGDFCSTFTVFDFGQFLICFIKSLELYRSSIVSMIFNRFAEVEIVQDLRSACSIVNHLLIIKIPLSWPDKKFFKVLSLKVL